MDNNQKKRKINFTRYNLERATNSHALILALVGAYLVWMIYMMINNYRIGETSMKFSTEVILVIVMCAAAAICFGYAIYIFYIVRHKEEIGREQDIERGYVDEYGNPIYYDPEEDPMDATGEEPMDASPKDAADASAKDASNEPEEEPPEEDSEEEEEAGEYT